MSGHFGHGLSVDLLSGGFSSNSKLTITATDLDLIFIQQISKRYEGKIVEIAELRV